MHDGVGVVGKARIEVNVVFVTADLIGSAVGAWVVSPDAPGMGFDLSVNQKDQHLSYSPLKHKFTA